MPIGVFGVAFGVLAREAEMSSWSAVAMSATTFGGSAQFAAASVLASGGSWATASLAAVALNARYLGLSLLVAPSLRWASAWRRFFLLQMVIDQSWAIAQTRRGIDGRLMVGAGVACYATWVLGTVVGVLAGDVLDPETLGLDAMFPALFLLLLRPHLDTRVARRAALIAAVIAAALVAVLPAGLPLLLAAGGALLAVRWRRIGGEQ